MWSRMPPSAIARSVCSTIAARPVVAGAGVLAQQEQQLARPRELRRVAEAAAPLVEALLELPAASRRAAPASTGAGGVVPAAERGQPRSTISAADFDCRRAPRARPGAISWSTSTKPGRPHCGVGGK